MASVMAARRVCSGQRMPGRTGPGSGAQREKRVRGARQGMQKETSYLWGSTSHCPHLDLLRVVPGTKKGEKEKRQGCSSVVENMMEGMKAWEPSLVLVMIIVIRAGEGRWEGSRRKGKRQG